MTGSEPKTQAGRLILMAGLTFGSGKRLADYPALVLAIEVEAADSAQATITALQGERVVLVEALPLFRSTMKGIRGYATDHGDPELDAECARQIDRIDALLDSTTSAQWLAEHDAEVARKAVEEWLTWPTTKRWMEKRDSKNRAEGAKAERERLNPITDRVFAEADDHATDCERANGHGRHPRRTCEAGGSRMSTEWYQDEDGENLWLSKSDYTYRQALHEAAGPARDVFGDDLSYRWQYAGLVEATLTEHEAGCCCAVDLPEDDHDNGLTCRTERHEMAYHFELVEK